jgi:hypothetical protein
LSQELGLQPRPSAVEGPWPERRIVLSGFASREMHEAYLRWLNSGAAHEAFGTWADERGLT